MSSTSSTVNLNAGTYSSLFGGGGGGGGVPELLFTFYILTGQLINMVRGVDSLLLFSP